MQNQINKTRIEKLKDNEICVTCMKKLFLRTSFFILILLSLVNYADNLMSINGENSNNTASINNDNNASLDVSNLVYDIDSNPFNVSYADWTEKWWQWTYYIPWDR